MYMIYSYASPDVTPGSAALFLRHSPDQNDLWFMISLYMIYDL